MSLDIINQNIKSNFLLPKFEEVNNQIVGVSFRTNTLIPSNENFYELFKQEVDIEDMFDGDDLQIDQTILKSSIIKLYENKIHREIRDFLENYIHLDGNSDDIDISSNYFLDLSSRTIPGFLDNLNINFPTVIEIEFEMLENGDEQLYMEIYFELESLDVDEDDFGEFNNLHFLEQVKIIASITDVMNDIQELIDSGEMFMSYLFETDKIDD